MAHPGVVASPQRQAATDAYLSNMVQEGADLHSRQAREGLWSRQGAEGQGRILDAQLHDEREMGLNKATQQWNELNDHNAALVGNLSEKMGAASLPPASDPTGALSAVRMPPTAPTADDDRRKRQLLTNQMLVDEVEKHEGRTLRHHQRVQQQARGQQEDFGTRNSEGNKLLDAYCDGYGAADKPQLSRRELFERVGLELSWDAIQGMLSQWADAPGSDLSHLRSVQDLVDGRGDARRLLDSLQRCHPDKNTVTEYVRAVTSFFETSGHEFLDVPVILKMLRQSDSILEQLRARVDALYDERRRHLEETEDFVAAEKAHNIIDDVLEELLNVHSERLELLDGAGQDDGFIDKVKASGARVCELTREVHERTHRLPAAPVPDMQRVDAAIEEAKTKLRDDNERHKKRESDLLAQLKDNEDEQAHKFERMMEVHDQIVELAAERQALVEQLMSQTQDINARHAAHDVFVEQCAAHRRLLDSLASMTQVIAPTLVSTEPFVQHTLQAIDTTVSDARRDTADVMLRERRAYYKVFHEFYLVCGEMLYTKERRREEIDGQLEDAKWNVKMCRHTLDPNVRVYQERVKQLELTRTAVDADIADLMRRMDSAASEASPVEDMLQEAGDDIVSPAILLQEQNVAKQQALIVEKKIVTERKTAKVEQLEEEAARVAVSASAAKRSGGTTSQMRPLSPSGPGEAPANAALSLSPEKRRALGDQKRRNYAERLRRTVGTENGGVDPSLQFGSPDKGGSTVIRQGRGNMVV